MNVIFLPLIFLTKRSSWNRNCWAQDGKNEERLTGQGADHPGRSRPSGGLKQENITSRLLTCLPLLLSLAQAADLPTIDKPIFPYGAVYFRKSNPPEQDWARDHQTAARIGMNTFRYWFMWSAIEVAPGKYDWRDYDRMMDLAAQNGIKVVIAEFITAAPEWAFRKYPHAHFRASDGSTLGSSIGGSSATGGFPGLCLDNPDVRAAAETFPHSAGGALPQSSGAAASEIRNAPASLKTLDKNRDGALTLMSCSRTR